MKLGRVIQKGAMGVIAVTLFLCPVGTFAETPGDTTAESSPATNQGPASPPGPEGKSYYYNATTGLWENEHYTWNPATGETKAKDSAAPTYNPATKTWDTTVWQYDAAAGKYVPRVTQKPAAPEVNAPTPSTENAAAIASSGPQTTATALAGQDATATAQAGNNVTAVARSGNAAVSYNTTGGSALSGSAQSIVNVLNLLQSSWGTPGNSDIATFTADINGGVVGDLLIDPSSFDGTVLPTTGVTQNDLDVHVATDMHLDNTIIAGATSGNAIVDHNTTGGDATSGTATALANVVNLINSTIAAGKSFVGTININGDFEGDILFPQALRALLGNGSTTSSSLTDGSFTGTFDETQSITNNISLAAQSGATSVAGNTTAGNATTGNADTNLTIYNLTGRQIIGSNALLVCVNVLGQWLGMIVDAPIGATAAMLGSGITDNYALSGAGDANMSLASTNSITNNITAYAASGDASVDHNTTAGDATSGNANAGVNVANFMGSQLSLADWFGILFINVLGNWSGSVGVDTAMGNRPSAVLGQSDNTPGTGQLADMRVFQIASSGAKLKPSSLNGKFKAILASSRTSGGSTNGADQVLAASTTPEKPDTPSASANKKSFFWVILVTILVATILLGIERLLSRRQTLLQRQQEKKIEVV